MFDELADPRVEALGEEPGEEGETSKDVATQATPATIEAANERTKGPSEQKGPPTKTSSAAANPKARPPRTRPEASDEPQAPSLGEHGDTPGGANAKRASARRTPPLAGSDPSPPLTRAESLARRIPGARLRTWEGAGHFFWAHRTAEVCTELAQFLESSD